MDISGGKVNKGEYVKVISKENPWEEQIVSREAFYEGVKVSEVVESFVEVVNIIMLDSKGDFVIQKRSPNKGHNPGLLDKTVGGHVKVGDSIPMTILLELLQELRIPSNVIDSGENIYSYYMEMKKYMETMAIVKQIATTKVETTKIIDGREVKVGNQIHFALGIFDGPQKNIDGEASGIMYYSYEQLLSEIESNPDDFTFDLKYLLEEYKEEIIELINFLKKQIQS